MATSKTKRASTKKAKVTKKKAKAEKRTSIDESRKIKAYAGQEHHFYKGFPRGEAYEILTKARNRTMVVSTFLDKIEKLPKVKNRAQARGIVQKLVGKPGDTGEKGTVARFV